MDAPETNQWVVISGVVVAVLTSISLASSKVQDIIRPVGTWWATRRERRALRVAEIEAAAILLNDQRVDALTKQVQFLAEELRKSNDELRASREETAALRTETIRLHGEVASLRAELAAYRTGGGPG